MHRALNTEQWADGCDRTIGVKNRQEAGANRRANRVQQVDPIRAKKSLTMAVSPVVDVVSEKIRDYAQPSHPLDVFWMTDLTVFDPVSVI